MNDLLQNHPYFSGILSIVIIFAIGWVSVHLSYDEGDED
jgi:hypothetical protein